MRGCGVLCNLCSSFRRHPHAAGAHRGTLRRGAARGETTGAGMGSALLPTLRLKSEVDTAIRDTLDKVLVLRFGRATDAACLHLDDIVSALSSIPPQPLHVGYC